MTLTYNQCLPIDHPYTTISSKGKLSSHTANFITTSIALHSCDGKGNPYTKYVVILWKFIVTDCAFCKSWMIPA